MCAVKNGDGTLKLLIKRYTIALFCPLFNSDVLKVYFISDTNKLILKCVLNSYRPPLIVEHQHVYNSIYLFQAEIKLNDFLSQRSALESYVDELLSWLEQKNDEFQSVTEIVVARVCTNQYVCMLPNLNFLSNVTNIDLFVNKPRQC